MRSIYPVIMPLAPKFPYHWLSLTSKKKEKPIKEKAKRRTLVSIDLAHGPRFTLFLSLIRKQTVSEIIIQ